MMSNEVEDRVDDHDHEDWYGGKGVLQALVTLLPIRKVCFTLDTLTQILYFIFVKKCCCIEKKNNNCIVTMAIHHSIQKTPLHVGCGLTKTRTFCCTMYITLLLVVRYKITIEKYMHFVSYSLFDSIHSFKSCCCTAVWMEFLF